MSDDPHMLDKEGLEAAYRAAVEEPGIRHHHYQPHVRKAIRAYLSASRSPRASFRGSCPCGSGSVEGECDECRSPRDLEAAVAAGKRAILTEIGDDSWQLRPRRGNVDRHVGLGQVLALAFVAAFPHLVSGPVLPEGETEDG